MYNVLLGTCIGDSLGMQFESRPASDENLLAWDGKSFGSSEHHKLTFGQYTDDGQFSICVAQSLIDNNGFNPEDLAQRYVDLFDSKTIRGYGRTTLAAINNLRSGIPYTHSGILSSYGNGTAMRAAPFGVFFRDDLNTLLQVVKTDSEITHFSDEAVAGGLAIAIASYLICNGEEDKNILNTIVSHIPDSVVKERLIFLNEIISFDTNHQDVLKYFGTKADVRQTVPSALYCYLKFDNFQDGVETAIRGGNDTDTTAAIVAALFGTKLGKEGIPDRYYTVEDFDKLIQLDNKLSNGANNKLFPR